MNRNSLLVLLFFAAACWTTTPAQEAQPSAESRMRDALRSTMLQLRDAQNQVATLQASQAQSDKDNADLKAKIDALTAQVAAITKQSADDKSAADKALADQKAANAEQATQIAKLNDALAAWQKDDKQYVQLAKDKEAARAQLAAQVIVLQRMVDDREAKNIALYDLGNEILTRYQQYGLGEALAAKEPFTGLARVKLQELVQDYRDKISDQRVKSNATASLRLVPTAHPPAAPQTASNTVPNKTETP